MIEWAEDTMDDEEWPGEYGADGHTEGWPMNMYNGWEWMRY